MQTQEKNSSLIRRSVLLRKDRKYFKEENITYPTKIEIISDFLIFIYQIIFILCERSICKCKNGYITLSKDNELISDCSTFIFCCFIAFNMKIIVFRYIQVSKYLRDLQLWPASGTLQTNK